MQKIHQLIGRQGLREGLLKIETGDIRIESGGARLTRRAAQPDVAHIAKQSLGEPDIDLRQLAGVMRGLK